MITIPNCRIFWLQLLCLMKIYRTVYLKIGTKKPAIAGFFVIDLLPSLFIDG
jgi:hypothetical protein